MTYTALAKLKKNSVSTTTTADITAIATSVAVTQTSVFYNADNTLILQGAVLGFDSATETATEEITISACSTEGSGKTGPGTLTIARGVKADGTIGAGYAWPSGTKIAVMFSTGVYDRICDNIAAHESGKAAVASLTGTAETLGGSADVGSAATAARSDHKHAITNPAIDTLAAATDITTRDASTSAHGLVVKATAPASTMINVVGIGNGETAYTNKALFDATAPTTQAFGDSAVVGTATATARRDHKHAMPALPAIDACGAATDITTRDATTSAHGLLPKVVAGASTGLIKIIQCAYGTTTAAWAELFDATAPAKLGTEAVGSAVTTSRRDHVHSAELTLADGKSVELKVALGTNETVSGTTAIFTDGDTMTIGMVGYVKDSTGFKTFRALATNAAVTMPGLVLATNTSGTFLLRGFARHDAWNWTVGGVLYVDATTAGSMTQAAPTGAGKVVQAVGYAVTADIIFFNPSMTWVELSA